jgi:hypothetical protein
MSVIDEHDGVMQTTTDTVTFAEFAEQAPELAGPITERFTSRGIGLLGTIRRDGSPRVSPIEVSVQDGRLWVGMMPGSLKLADVRRDPRVSLLTAVSDKDDLGGEGKLFGVLDEVTDPELAGRLLAEAASAGDHSADDLAGSPMFEVRVGGASWQHVGDDAWHTVSWRVGAGMRRRRRLGATGLPEDVAS